MSDASKEVTDVYHINDDMIGMCWRHKDGMAPTDNFVNVIMAALTTSHGRLKLYSFMEQWGHNLLYTDTDSAIIVAGKKDALPVDRSMIGHWKDELPNEKIIQFACAGPKNYGLKMSSGRSFCRIRGFTLSVGNSEKLNFDNMKNIILKNKDGKIETVNPCDIRGDKFCQLRISTSHKYYRMVHEKRVLVGDSTIPIGSR